jgi:hypothetical protein
MDSTPVVPGVHVRFVVGSQGTYRHPSRSVGEIVKLVIFFFFRLTFRTG